MRSNDIKALHDKSIQELQVQLDGLVLELAHARLQKGAGKLKNTHIAMLSDDVARLKTIISIKEKQQKA